ncbi:MAG: sigma-54-dependent Fis family transcriptional regulator [Deltaproteobacteria bacterium]|nr:sigma-54-dependent Fis family transcriptional regulator [Deltaproteobacteria bacterium]
MSGSERGLVLVVDDEPGVRMILGGLLRQLGYSSVEAAGADEALAALQREPVDVVISDYLMPGHDGLWLLGELRRSQVQTPVVMLTAHATVDVAVEAMRRGAFDFLTKPVDRDALAQVLQKAVPVAEQRFLEGGQMALVAASPQMQAVMRLCERMLRSKAPVLITGASGTGKEVVAKHLHRLRCGEEQPFVAVNCSAIPEALLESELFGHVKGAFTGATCDKPGRVEQASGGTLFLDEIGDLPLAIQVKLLRLVQEKTFERVGGLGTKSADICIVAATHRDLAAMVQQKTFREDLYFRLNVLPLHLTPLRERGEDIAPLARGFLARAAAANSRPPPELTEDAIAHLRTLPWPGNARELGNLMERVAALCEGSQVTVGQIEECRQLGLASAADGDPGLAAGAAGDERALVEQALARARGNRTLAARLLGVSRRTLYYKLERHGLS